LLKFQPYIDDFRAAFGAVLESGKIPQFIEDGKSAYGHRSTAYMCARRRASKAVTLFNFENFVLTVCDIFGRRDKGAGQKRGSPATAA
jgi:hypothetical protein